MNKEELLLIIEKYLNKEISFEELKVLAKL